MASTGAFGQPQPSTFSSINQSTGAFGAAQFNNAPQNTQNYGGFPQQPQQNKGTGFGGKTQGGNPLFD